jgi:hypothetical protein
VSSRSATAPEAAHGQGRLGGFAHAEGGGAPDTGGHSPLASGLVVRPTQVLAEDRYAAQLVHEAVRTTEEAIARARRPGHDARERWGSLRARVISEPTEYAQFGNFSCGDPATSRSVREVQATIRMLHAGRFDPAPTAVVIESELGELLALCCLRSLPAEEEWSTDWSVDIPAFARASAHRGTVLGDGQTTLGEAVLRAALQVISKACAGRSRPAVLARVLPFNGESHAAFERLGFRLRTPTRRKGIVEEQVVRVLAPGSPWPEPLDPTVLAPVQSDPSTLAPRHSAKAFRPPETPRNAPCPCGSGAKWKLCCEPYFS